MDRVTAKKALLLLIAFLAIISVLIALYNLKARFIDEAMDHLKTVNQKVAFSLHRQISEITQDAQSMIAEPSVKEALANALRQPLTDAQRLPLLRNIAQQVFLHHYRGFYLIDKNQRTVLALKKHSMSDKVPEAVAQSIKRLASGEQSSITHPFLFQGKAVMWSLIPVPGKRENIIGYFALQLGQQHTFSATTLNTGIAFDSMETYLVDNRGFMLSESRFTNDLLQAGLLQHGESSVLKVRVLNPGTNLLKQHKTMTKAQEHHFTLAVQRALQNKEHGGQSRTPYLDYRGIPVLGVWQWDKQLDAAIISEVDWDEALATYTFARNIIIVLMVLVILGGIIASVIYSRLRLRAEREAGHHRDLLLKSTAECIYGIDTEGLCTFVNQAFVDTLGYTERELIGKNIHQLIHHSRPDGTPLPVEECNIYRAHQERTRIHRSDEVFWRKDGTPIHVEYWSHPLFEGQETIGSVVTFLDITSKIRAEEERASLEKQVQHSQRLESLGVLAGGIAHDFNNLLAAILGNASLAKSNVLRDPLKSKERIDNIIHSAERAGVLCKQMLAYSGKGRFILKPINISGIVEEMTHLLEISIDKSVVIKYHLAHDLPLIMVDEAQIQQVIMNLVTNANEAIGGRSGVISVTTGMMHADREYLSACFGDHPVPGRYIYVEVSDTGCGMDKDTIDRIFDPFFTTKMTGRGLGMSAVLGIVRGHKGALKVYSEPGRGTTFKFLLPLTEKVHIAANPDNHTEELRNHYAGRTALIVDDEETVREMACAILEEMGFDILSAENGEEALKLYRRHADNIALILTDLTMPKMGGKELFSELKKINPDCHVILSSGYNSEDAIQQFSGKGLAGFLQKPYTANALAREVRKIMEAAA